MIPLGRIKAIHGDRIELTNARDARERRRGDTLALSWASGTGGDNPPFRTGRLVVAAVNIEGGELVCTRPIHEQVVAAVGHDEFGDWLYLVDTGGAR